jgi:hypothetical protein
VSYSNSTLCLAVPVSATNSGTGAVYAMTAEVQLSGWIVSTGRASFPVAPHGSRSATFTLCAPGFTAVPDTCDAVDAAVLHYWGDPTPSLGILNAMPSPAGSICFPR